MTTPTHHGPYARRKMPAIEESLDEARTRITREIEDGPDFVPPALLYSTADELAFIARMVAKGRRCVLEALLLRVDQRWWSGPGMRVDVGEVRRALVVALGGGEA